MLVAHKQFVDDEGFANLVNEIYLSRSLSWSDLSVFLNEKVKNMDELYDKLDEVRAEVDSGNRDGNINIPKINEFR